MLWGLQHLLNTPWAYISTSYQSYCNQHGYSLSLGVGRHICTFPNSPLGYFISAHYNKLVYKPTSASRLEPNLNPARQTQRRTVRPTRPSVSFFFTRRFIACCLNPAGSEAGLLLRPNRLFLVELCNAFCCAVTVIRKISRTI